MTTFIVNLKNSDEADDLNLKLVTVVQAGEMGNCGIEAATDALKSELTWSGT